MFSREHAKGSVPVLLVLLTDEISNILVRGQLAAIRGAGFDVHVGVCRRNPGSTSSVPFDEGVTVHHVGFRREPSLRRDLSALWACVRLVRRLRPAIVNASTPKAALIGMLAAWICRVPVRVAVIRGLRSERMTGAGGWLVRLLERMSVKTAHHVLVNSDSLRSVAVRDGLLAPGQGIVLGNGSGNGVDLERFTHTELPCVGEARRALGLQPDSVVIGFVGRLTADKGIADLLGAFGGLRGEALELLLVGPLEKGDALNDDERRRIAADTRVVHVPWLDDTRLAYAAMDLLAFPSYREGLPNVPLEAQMCSVPVVGDAATGTVDAVDIGVTGVLVPTGDREALAATLQCLIDQPATRERLGAAGRRWVSTTFDQRMIWDELIERYREWCTAAGRYH